MAPEFNEADIIFNRANVALAKAQRLVASWLPARTEAELQNAKTAEEIDKDEEAMFTPVPELLGLGAKVPEDIKDGDLKRQKQDLNEQLRKQLLGSHYKKGQRSGLETRFQKVARVDGLVGSKPRPVAEKRKAESKESEGDENGRSSLGKSKRSRNVEQGEEMDTMTSTNDEHAISGHKADIEPKRKASHYLDEVLAQSAQKKSKKKRK